MLRDYQLLQKKLSWTTGS